MRQKYYIIGLFFMVSTIIADCFICNQPIKEGEEYWRNDNMEWHESCHVCSYCNKPIKDSEDVIIDQSCNAIYTHDCYIHKHDPLCKGCYNNVGYHENSLGLGKYCDLCQSQLIGQRKDIERDKRYVLNLLFRNGFKSKFEKLRQVEIKIVDEKEMRKISKGTNDGNNGGYCKGPLFFGLPTIYILEDFTKSQFLGALAHEYIHAWMMINDVHMSYGVMKHRRNFRGLSFNEGFAQIGSYLVWDDLELFSKIEHQLNLNRDPYYGQGYRNIEECLVYYDDLESFIQKVLEEKDFSCFPKETGGSK